jgi:hypothetical protein
MTAVIILLVLLGGGGIWMYRQGGKSIKGAYAIDDLETLQEINEADNDFDQNTDDIFRQLDGSDYGKPRLPRDR